MSDRRDEKLKTIIQNLAATFVGLESSNASLITVTRVELLDHAKRALILFTTLPTEKEGTALLFLKRKRAEFQEYVRENSRVGRIPFFDFEIDLGEKNRQNIDRLGV